jgi:Domain of unknown function (DUF4331)
VSHHLDSPLARQDTRLDITDVYLFRGTAGTVFVMNVNSSVAGRNYPERFHPEALYEFNADTDGDGLEDVTLRVSFGPGEADGRQALEVRRLDGAAARDRSAAGVVLAQGRTGDHIVGEGGVRVWAGIAGEPFYIEPTVLGAIRTAVASGAAVDRTGWHKDQAVNAFANTTVHSIVLEVPDGAFGATTIGFWGVTALATDAGDWRQINRAGQPMIQPIFNPMTASGPAPTTRPSRERTERYTDPSSARLSPASSPPWERAPTPGRTASGCPNSASRTSCATRSGRRRSSVSRSAMGGRWPTTHPR